MTVASDDPIGSSEQLDLPNSVPNDGNNGNNGNDGNEGTVDTVSLDAVFGFPDLATSAVNDSAHHGADHESSSDAQLGERVHDGNEAGPSTAKPGASNSSIGSIGPIRSPEHSKPSSSTVQRTPKIRRIAHLDMDAFFASVELLRYPQLKGLPVVIGGSRVKASQPPEASSPDSQETSTKSMIFARGDSDSATSLATRHDLDDEFASDLSTEFADEFEDSLQESDTESEELGLSLPDSTNSSPWNANTPVEDFPILSSYKGRGVITTATYAARVFGVGSAMGMMKAAQLCPHAIVLPMDFEQYRYYSSRFKAIAQDICPVIENRGVDEIYLDLTDVPGGQREGGRVIARLIQKTIFQATGLTCSIGVAPNKMLAKLASEFNKPNGISIILESDVAQVLKTLPCKKLNGIGPKANERLKLLGIETLGDLAQVPLDRLMAEFGKKYGEWLYQSARGIDERAVETHSEPVSISKETTFSRDLHVKLDRVELGEIFTRLCEQLSHSLITKSYASKTIGIKIKFDNFKTLTRDFTLSEPIQDAKSIRQAASQALKRVNFEHKMRLLGVRASSLMKVHASVNSELAPNTLNEGLPSGAMPVPVSQEGDQFTLFD